MKMDTGMINSNTNAVYGSIVFLFLILLTMTLTCIIFRYQHNKQTNTHKNNISTISTLLYLGSGGHTTEMLQLVKKLNHEKYHPIHIVLSHSDHTSLEKVHNSDITLLNEATIHRISRSREVKQSWITTITSTIYSFFDAMILIFQVQPKLVICNGPGTCVPICFCTRLFNYLGLFQSKIVFVESFCRVKSLSLSGYLVYPITDKFIVQWPQLAIKYKKAEYIGVIC